MNLSTLMSLLINLRHNEKNDSIPESRSKFGRWANALEAELAMKHSYENHVAAAAWVGVVSGLVVGFFVGFLVFASR